MQKRAEYFRRKSRAATDPEQKARYLKQSKMGTKAFCDYCDTVFETYGKNLRYCSEDCKKSVKREARGAKTHEECRGCGQIFHLRGKGGYKYCPECRGEYMLSDQKPENNTKSIKQLMEEYEEVKAGRINPFFLKRGRNSTRTGESNLVTDF
jgi:hypothetical protein